MRSGSGTHDLILPSTEPITSGSIDTGRRARPHSVRLRSMGVPDDAEMLRLVDAEDLDGIAAIVTPADIADTWARYHLLADDERGHDAPGWWAVELWLSKWWWDDDERMRAGLLALAERVPDDLIPILGAGPVEMVACDDEACVHWLERTLPTSPRLVEALRHAWFAGDVSERTFARIEAAAGTRLRNPLRDAIEGLPPYEP